MFVLHTNARFDDLERLVDKITRMGNGDSRKIADGIKQMHQENFTRQGSGAGQWAGLAQSTIRERRRLGFGGERPILVRRGNLRAGYVNRGSPDHHERIWQSPIGLTIESGSADERIALLHERGTSKMPARSVSQLDDGQENRLVQIIDYVIEQIERREWK